MDINDTPIRVRKTLSMFNLIVKKLIDDNWALQPYPASLTIGDGLRRLDSLFPDGATDGRVVDFVVYQIYRFRDMIEDKGSNWRLSWCFSDNAVSKYKAQFFSQNGKTGINYYIDQWLDDADLTRDKLEDIISEKKRANSKSMYIYIEAEDNTKRRFLNTDTGYMLCQKSTTGWSPKSPVCSSCEYSIKCESDTELKYPEVYRLRKESQYGK